MLWDVAENAAAAKALVDSLGVSPLVAQVLVRRGLGDEASARTFLEPALRAMHDPRQLAGCVAAASRLAAALRSGETVAIYGDYDVDGITATAILYHVLTRAAPRARVLRYVPHRIVEGYGLHCEAIEGLAKKGAKVIVTVDCGITAVEPAAFAREQGVDLIITDHHEPPPLDRLPPALAIVHPGLPGDDGELYPFRDICGAAVAYKLAWQFARTWCGSDIVTPELRRTLLDVLSLAALGTVADVVPLHDENRAIVTFGLNSIKATKLVGLNALIDATRLRDEKINSTKVGFVIGPRLNACGRMGHAQEAVDLLTVSGPQDAAEIARGLEAVNDRRRATEQVIFTAAHQMVLDRGDDDPSVRVLVLGHADWHPGVIGIVASRLIEAFGKPTVMLRIGDEEARGSARSIGNFNLVAAFEGCSEHLESFGGHAMAAGVHLRPEAIDGFREALNRYATEHMTADDLIPRVVVDAAVEIGDLTLDVCEDLERLAPFGRSNPAPRVLIEDARVVQRARRMGHEERHLLVTVEQGRHRVRCVGWRLGEFADRLPIDARVDLVGEPERNTYRGNTTVQLNLADLRWR